MVKAAVDRGLTHLAITDHDRIDVAQEARALADGGLTVIVGEEVKTRDGDLICVFLERAIPPGMSAMETIAAAREQGGLVGIPHPFDRMRGSLLRDAAMASLAPHVDWVEAHNARVVGHGNEDASAFALEHGLPGHRRVGRAFDHGDRRRLHRARRRSVDAGRPARRAGRPSRSCPGRASYFVRLWTPIAKGVNRLRGNGRIQPVATVHRPRRMIAVSDPTGRTIVRWPTGRTVR